MPTYTLIQTASIPTNATTITFSSLPTVYNDLVIRMSDRRGTGGNVSLRMTYNGSTGTGQYYTKGMYSVGSNTSISSFFENNSFGSLYGGVSTDDSATSGTHGYLEYYISDFKSTNKHKVSFTNSLKFDPSTMANNVLYINAQRRSNTEAITSITLTEQSGGYFSAGSDVSIYGISNS